MPRPYELMPIANWYTNPLVKLAEFCLVGAAVAIPRGLV